MLTWLLANPLISGMGLLGLAGGLAALLLSFGSTEQPTQVNATIDGLLATLEAGDYDEVKAMAKALAADEDSVYNRGVASYALGRILVHRDCQTERREDRRKGLYLIASRYFDEADLQQVPPFLQPEVSYWWGKSLFLAGEELAARQPLLKAIGPNSELESKRKEILEYLALIHLGDKQLSKQQGVQYTDQVLADLTLPQEKRDYLLALKTKLLLQDERLEEAAEIYKLLPDDSKDLREIYSELGKARLREAVRMEELRQADPAIQDVYQQALDAFERNPADSMTDSDTEFAMKEYLRGRAQKGAGYITDAEFTFSNVRRKNFDQPIGIAAGFWEALCLLEQEKYKDAQGLYTGMLKETVRANNQGESEWLNADSITKMVGLGVNRYLKLENYAAAVDLADQFRTASTLREPAIPLSHSAKMKATALQRWVSRLEEQLTQAEHRDQPRIQDLLKEKYNDYGHALYSLAVNRFASNDYAKDLYEAGEAFFMSEDYRRATLAFKQYLDTNDDSQAAQTRLRIGQSLLAQRNFQDALEALSSCWALYPNDPVVYKARYQAAECYLELGNPAKAEEMLRANLDNDALTPSSQEWIESLFLLGNLLFEEGLKLEAASKNQANVAGEPTEDPTLLMEQANEYYSRAISRLIEAVLRQPNLPAAKLGRYHLAEAYRRSNVWNELQLSRTTINARRIELTQLIQKANEKAISHFDLLEQHLNQIREERPLDPNEEALLRNTYFSRGNLYFQLNRFDDAILMYRMASNMVIQEPEVLEAYVQIASCYRKLNRHDEASRVINQAKIILRDRIPVDADFEATTRFARDRWVTLLDWLSTI